MLCSRLGVGLSGGTSAPSFQFQKVTGTDSFIRFSKQYVRHLLIPVELPAIVTASTLVSQNALKELLVLDAQLEKEPLMKLFSQASRTLGRNQLRKLSGLRDVRLLSRYRSAVLENDAYGWHVLVYGAVLHLFSIPLRQGLDKYQWQVLTGFAHAACQSLQWSDSDWRKVMNAIENIPVTSLESLGGNDKPEVPKLAIV